MVTAMAVRFAAAIEMEIPLAQYAMINFARQAFNGPP